MTLASNVHPDGRLDPVRRVHPDVGDTLRTRRNRRDRLNVVAVVSNPCGYRRRYELAARFVETMKRNPDVRLFVAELAYGDQPFVVTESMPDDACLRIRTDSPALWQKEAMINRVVRTKLPQDWTSFAWIDADVEFDNPTWATDALDLMDAGFDVLQLFGYCHDLAADGSVMAVHRSSGMQYSEDERFRLYGFDAWHPGYAWAMTREFFSRSGGLYDAGILGSGDSVMMMSWIGLGPRSINRESSDGFKASVASYQSRCGEVVLGYVPGVIRHNFHGAKKNRGYEWRWKILVRHAYDPATDVELDPETGLVVPTAACLADKSQMLDEIRGYFESRREDDGA